MIRMLSSLSHSSSASTTRTYEDRELFSPSLDSGRRTSWCHWSRRDWLAMSRHSVRALHMCWSREGMLFASCQARLVTNLLAWPTSPPPREKKKLAPRRFCFAYPRATVRAIVDFPVPARPFSQKIHRSSCPFFPSAQSYISCRRSTRVSGRQAGSCWRS
jgi:hypothetical protein